MSLTLRTPYASALERVRGALADAGFGVLTEIDLAATLKAKLDVDTDPRIILGACRPQLAHQALAADPRVAALLPCNVVVAALPEGGSRVEVLDPQAMALLSREPGLADVVADARGRLQAMLADLAETSEAAEASEAAEEV